MSRSLAQAPSTLTLPPSRLFSARVFAFLIVAFTLGVSASYAENSSKAAETPVEPLAATIVNRLATTPAVSGTDAPALSGAAAPDSSDANMPADTGDGHAAETSLVLSTSLTTRAEVQVKLSGSVEIPAFAGTEPLTQDNNVRVVGELALSPVSVSASAEVVLTPIAFFQVVTGGMVATGWSFLHADGLSLNEPGKNPDGSLDGSSRFTEKPFIGLVLSCKGGLVLQGDLAAAYPGEWNHVVFRSYQSVWYRALTAAKGDASWQYENDVGEERNGWNYYANYLLGYRMPLRFRLAGLLLEQEMNLYRSRGREAWGDDLSRFTLGLMGEYELESDLTITAFVQIRTKRNYVDGTGDIDYYRLRKIDRDDPRSFEFYRVAAVVAWKLK